VHHKLVEKSGAWYSFQGERIGQGRENARKYLIENREMTDRLDTMIRELLLPDSVRKSAGETAEPVGAN